MGKIDWMRGCFILLFIVSLYGCATTADVRILDREIYRLSSQLNALQKEKDSLKTEVQKEIPALKTDLGSETKKLQADLLLRVEALQSQIRTLSTDVEEYKEFLKRPSKEIERMKEDVALRMRTLEEKDKTVEEKNKVQEDRIRTMEERIKRIEDQLKMIGAKIDQVASKQIEEEKTPKGEAPVDVKGLSTGAGDLYKDAYETLQKGDLEKARRKFEAFLKQYPNTELSDNAQFWIGETYYLKKDFEKAILEYEKAITKYPEGDKVPAALFKQALAFLELGEKSSARDLLKRVIDRYPHSEQAEMAKKKLEATK
ncbi:MAG: tol-pal system protein YbgF [Thermodesulfobacteriota bacterium]|jgi:tol-pal system protein YbgF